MLIITIVILFNGLIPHMVGFVTYLRGYSETFPHTAQLFCIVGHNPVMSEAPYWFAWHSLRGNHGNRCLLAHVRQRGAHRWIRGVWWGALGFLMTLQIGWQHRLRFMAETTRVGVFLSFVSNHTERNLFHGLQPPQCLVPSFTAKLPF